MARSRPAPASHARRPHPFFGLFFFVLMAPVLLLAMACETLLLPPDGDQAALPPGFADLQVPDAPLVAVLYFNQGSPVSVSPDALGLTPAGGEEAAAVALTSFAVLLGVGDGAVAIQGTAATEEGAESLADAAEKAVADDGGWVVVNGTTVTVARNGGEWASALKAAVENGASASLKTAYPEAWETVDLLPSGPPHTPIVVGVLLDSEEIERRLADAQTPALNHLGTVLGAVPSQGGAAVAGYAEEGLDLTTTEVDAVFLERANLRGVVAFRTGLLGAFLSPVLGTLSSALNLEPVQDGDQQYYRYQRQEGTALIVPRGPALYVVGAPGASLENEALLDYLDDPAEQSSPSPEAEITPEN